MGILPHAANGRSKMTTLRYGMRASTVSAGALISDLTAVVARYRELQGKTSANKHGVVYDQFPTTEDDELFIIQMQMLSRALVVFERQMSGYFEGREK